MNIGSLGGAGASPGLRKPPELGQEDFLKLLVAQLKNQDPSNPMDNAEFLGQIAQFSMVSGIDGLQGSFNSVAGSMYATQALQASTLVGREVLAETGTAWLDGDGGVGGVVDLPADSFSGHIQIHDAAGKLVDLVQLPPADAGRQNFHWRGLDADGEPLPAGRYTLSASAAIDGEVQAVPLRIYSRVESVSVDRAHSRIDVHLEGGGIVGFSQVSEYK